MNVQLDGKIQYLIRVEFYRPLKINVLRLYIENTHSVLSHNLAFDFKYD